MAKKFKRRRLEKYAQKLSLRLTRWVGTPQSILVHTVLFASVFSGVLVGVSLDKILLILTTALSLEAIYLALFIQMTVNRQAAEIAAVGKDIDEISEDVDRLEELQEGVEDLSEGFDRMQKEDVEDEKEDENHQKQTQQSLQTIERHLMSVVGALKDLEADIESLRGKK